MNITRTAIVTGASRGIGRGIAVSLAKAGFNVAINYNSNATAADEAAAEVRAASGKALTVQANVGDLADHQRLLDATLQAFGSVDLLVNNAGVAPRVRADLLEASVDEYDFVMGTNLKGPYFLTQVVARQMVRQIAAGRDAASHMIVNIGSISAYTASVNRGEYCLSKAGMGMMTQLFAARLAEHGINVFEVRPGIIATDMTGAVKAKYDKLILEDGLLPIRRWGQPDDIGKAVAAIASGAMPYSTGQIIDVDGGFHIKRL